MVRDEGIEEHREPQGFRYLTFLERAEQETDPLFAEDLLFATLLALDIKLGGGLALAVGGYARDTVLAEITGQPQISKDLDIEVYGVEFDDLINGLGSYGKLDLVGASFGIAKVTNPVTGHKLDFSIPRADSKIDKGHRGFRVTGDPYMSVAEAARRRDLTINALALDPLTGELIDEYGGVDDLKAGILRATDPVLFGDDPLRVLRIMQFAGRFNFEVDPGTAELCRSLDLTELAAERVGEEWIKLMTKSEKPSVGLEVARQLGVLDQLHPELAVLDQIEQEPDWHPEGSVWNHTKNAADAAARVVREEGLLVDGKISEEAEIVLFGALVHDFGKATTTMLREKRGVMRITAHGHEAAGVEPASRFLHQIKLPHDTIKKILPIVRNHLWHVHHSEPTDEQIHKFAILLAPSNIRLWDLVSRSDSNGRGKGFSPRTPSYPIYERSLQFKVSEKPAEPIVRGRDLISYLNMKPGPSFKQVLDFLYEAQLGGQFTTVEEGLAYYHANKLLQEIGQS